jgi:hypothetical protein
VKAQVLFTVLAQVPDQDHQELPAQLRFMVMLVLTLMLQPTLLAMVLVKYMELAQLVLMPLEKVQLNFMPLDPQASKVLVVLLVLLASTVQLVLADQAQLVVNENFQKGDDLYDFITNIRF